MIVYAAGNGALGPVVADFNGDGVPDIAVENYTDGTESLLLGNGDGTSGRRSFSPPARIRMQRPSATSTAMAIRIWQFPTSAAATRPSCSIRSPRPRPLSLHPSQFLER